ncbi:MAG: serine/threonine protein kinase [Myxococcales bacterium]|nr:serine/threonine protein kinase [Myxococcales bacterium]
MGAVYLAEHPTIGKKIALKVIHRELAGNREVVQRFFQEARAVNKIGNEHIVEIHDFGVTPQGDHYYIMEYLEGQTLAAVMSRESAMDIARALHIGAQIASALAAAHASGVIHRDLKPDNIMLMNRLGDRDFVKVLDFGLAKMFAASGASAVQTAIGVLLGTPQYMSPEACESKRDIDHRTDIYALGVLLFQMMTGRLPFDGETMGEVLVKQVTALPPAPRGLNPAIPPSVEQILLRCLAKPVDARFATMYALRDALLDPEAYLRGSPPIAPARSVAPGEAMVDARQVMAHAEARARRMTGDGLPLPAPGSTMSDPAYGSPSQSRQIPIPGLAHPAGTKMNTMRIATPHGYSSRPPRKVWPIVLVVGLLLGLIGGAFVVAWFGDAEPVGESRGAAGPAGSGSAMNAAITGGGSATVEPITVETGSGSAVAVPVETGSASAPATIRELAKLTLDSVPRGATVFGPDGVALGKTPLKIEWPIATAAVTFTLKLRGFRDKVHEIAVTSNTMTRIDLERIPVANQGTRGSGSARKDDTGLERPD